jgi:hypothetical protein
MYTAALMWCALVRPTLCLGQYIDTESRCQRCHETTASKDSFCALVPAQIWRVQDKHNHAFLLLTGANETDPAKGQAKRALVKQILGFELREAFEDDEYSRLKTGDDEETKRRAATVTACLRCHATWPAHAQGLDAQTPPVPLRLGVSCQACHGPGAQWDAPHSVELWRCVTPAAKTALGFTDVRSPVHKAELCASCHVGSLAEERFVRHEWYAAGHPPLPSFELASFATQMPAHWKSLKEKGPFAFRDERPMGRTPEIRQWEATLRQARIPPEEIKASYREANFPEATAKGLDPTGDLPLTKEAIVAGVVALESYVRLVGDYAAGAVEGKQPWPELAMYDCAACHHELRGGLLGIKTRPERKNTPGRPPLATWPMVLAQLGAEQAEKKQGLSIAALEQAITGRPFGEPAEIKAAAEQTAASLAQLMTDVAATKFDEAAAGKAILFLTEPANFETNDYATARQVAWALRGMARDIGSSEAGLLFLKEQQDVLALALPSGQERSVMENLGRWLTAAARYDPYWFREELKNARARLAPRGGN